MPANTQTPAGNNSQRDDAQVLLDHSECASERPYGHPDISSSDASTNPEDRASCLSRVLFLWAFPVAYRGFRRGRTDAADLLPLPSGDAVDVLQERFREAWSRRVAISANNPSCEGTRKSVLIFALLSLTRGMFFRCVALRIAVAALTYMQPMLLHIVLKNMEEQVGTSGNYSLGTGIAAVLLGVVVTSYWLCWESFWFMNVRMHSCMRNVLMHFMYRKALYVATVSSSGYSGGSLQNLMVIDAMRMTSSYPCQSMFAICEASLSVIFAACQLCVLLDVASGLAGASVVATFAPLSFFMGRLLQKYVRRIQECRDLRGNLLFEYLSAMRVVKCFNLEVLVESVVADARAQELRWLRWRRMLLPIVQFVANSCGLMGMATAFTCYTLLNPGRALTAAQAFTALAWMNILNNSLSMLPRSLTSLIDVFVSIRRLERAFLFDTGEDWLRQLNDDASSHQDAEPCETLQPHFVIRDCRVEWPQPLSRDSIALGDSKRVFGSGLSFEVRPGALLLICGPVGCGKSTLLGVLSRTIPPSSGSCITAVGRSALVAQRPWLQNGTILENILFGQEMDSGRFARVLHACAFDEDLVSLPSGVHTLVGEMGVQLSGGQRQRVSLARALYAIDCDTVLLDDVLSALDAHVSQHVWEKAICTELGSRTRVVITHQVQYCQDPRVDKILVLGSDGSQEFFGTYAELQSNGGLSRLGLSDSKDYISASAGAVAATTPVAGFPRREEVSLACEGPAESRRTGGIAWADFLVYADSCGGVIVVVMISFPLLLYYVVALMTNWQLAVWTEHSQKSFTRQPYFLTELQDNASKSPNQSDSLHDLKVYLILVGLTSMLRMIFMLVVQVAAVGSSQRFYASLMSRLLRLELSFFDTTPTGQIMNRCLKDMSQIDDSLADRMLALVQAWLDAVTAAVVLTVTAPWSLIGVPPFCIGYALVMRIYRWPARDIKRLEAVSRSPVMDHFSDSIKGAATLRTYGHELRFMRRNLALVDGCARAFYTYWGIRSWNAMALEFLGSMLLIISVACITARAAHGNLSPGAVGLAFSYALTMPRQLMWISIYMADLETEFVAVERIAQYIRLLPETDVVPARGLEHTDVVGAGLAVKSAWFRYSASGSWVLKSLDLLLSSGSRTAIVGRTGCGKSSLVAAVVRLYPLESGQIFVQGRDVMSIPLAALRRSVRVLQQDPIMFAGTIRSNLLCLLGASTSSAGDDASLWAALRKLGLEEIIQSFGGLDTHITDAGESLSQGQKQLLCLCRVLIDVIAFAGGEDNHSEQRLLLCDEPTSNCDLATDATIHRVLLEELPRDWTVAVICHRLHRVRAFDRVVVLESGQVVEMGTPSELLATQASLAGARRWLREMCEAQHIL